MVVVKFDESTDTYGDLPPLFRSLELLLCTLSSVLLVETRQKPQVLVLKLRLELLHALA